MLESLSAPDASFVIMAAAYADDGAWQHPRAVAHGWMARELSAFVLWRTNAPEAQA